MGSCNDREMNIGDYLKALEQSGVKVITTSDTEHLKNLYWKHVLPKPQRECFKVHFKNKRAAKSQISSKIKRVKIVKKGSSAKELKTQAQKTISKLPSAESRVNSNSNCKNRSSGQESLSSKASAQSIQSDHIKRIRFSEDVRVLTYEQPKFKKTAVLWP